MAAPLRSARIEWQVDHHFCIVMLRLNVRVASWMFGEIRKEELVSDTVITVGRILDWGMLYDVMLMVANMLCPSSRTW